MTGRKIIYTDAATITSDNVVKVLTEAEADHRPNADDIDYLYRYYRGDQPILTRTKDVRPEICNRIVENRANEIVAFKVGYFMGEPVQYVSHSSDESNTDAINLLNEYMSAEDKQAQDSELATWMHICGVGYRIVLPDPAGEEDESPFEIHTLDPRNTFVVRSMQLGNPVVMGVHFVTRLDGHRIYTCYTKDAVYEILDGKITSYLPQILGIPIIEYPLNTARMGAFEIVLPLLDAINNVDSNRMDGVEQFVQALMLFHNVDIDEEDFATLRMQGAIKFRDADSTLKADIDYLTAELNQTQTQTLVDHLYDTVLTICGMPNRNGGSSTSDTGTAVIYRDGWSDAEARAKDTENMFRASEKVFLKSVLKICDKLGRLTLKLGQLEIKFTRRNYENIASKASVLTMMLGCEKIHPQLAFEYCNLFPDPDLAYTMSKDYEEWLDARNKTLAGADTDDGEDTVEGQDGNSETEEG